jgi:hypothetical protein
VDTGIADLFWVARGDTIDAGLVDGYLFSTHSDSTHPTEWSAPAQIGDPTVRAHPMANLAAARSSQNRMDILFIGRANATTDWLLHNAYWRSTNQWGAPGAANSNVIGEIPGPPIVHLEPLATIAACSRDLNSVDVFVIGVDGLLYRASLNVGTGVWSPLLPALPPGGPAPPRLASVDGACCQGPNDIEVVVTDWEGKTYATHWDTASGVHTRLERVHAPEI